MENIYHNTFFAIALSILYAVGFFNFGLSTYMLNGPPIVIEESLLYHSAGYGVVGPAGYSMGPIIYINPTDEPTWNRIIRHEYQHYMQTALLTPLGFNFAYLFEEHILGHDYGANFFEIDARNNDKDCLTFDVFYWNSKEILHVEWEW